VWGGGGWGGGGGGGGARGVGGDRGLTKVVNLRKNIKNWYWADKGNSEKYRIRVWEKETGRIRLNNLPTKKVV